MTAPSSPPPPADGPRERDPELLAAIDIVAATAIRRLFDESIDEPVRDLRDAIAEGLYDALLANPDVLQAAAVAVPVETRDDKRHEIEVGDLCVRVMELSSLLRRMARRAGELRREAHEEYVGRQVAEQNLRYAPVVGIEAYRRDMSAAFFARKPMPPIPEVITTGSPETGDTAPAPIRTAEWDAAFRENDTDPDQLDDETYASLTQPTSGDYGSVPDPRTGVPEAMHCACGRALPCRHCADEPLSAAATMSLRDALYQVERTFEPSADGEALVAALVLAVLNEGWRPARGSGTTTAAATSVATDDFIDALYDELPAVVTFPRAALEKAVAAALAGTAPTEQPAATFDDGPGVACGCCEIDWQLCRGLYDKGMSRCCSDCTHNLQAVALPQALIGTYADPDFRAHQDHKHPATGCGFCPQEGESDV